MSLLHIQPGVRRTSGAGSVSSAQPSKTQAEKTLRRDGHSCRFCGFTSEKFQRIAPNPAQGRGDEFVTCCTFCDQVINMERTGVAGSGILIWLPEMTQIELNYLVRTIYVARAAHAPEAEAATKALDALTARRAEAKKRLGSDDPLLLATVMIETLNDAEYKAAAKKLEGIRYLPTDKHMARSPQGDVNQFPAMLEYWQSIVPAYKVLASNT